MRHALLAASICLAALSVGLFSTSCVGDDAAAGALGGDAGGGPGADGGASADRRCSRDSDCPPLPTSPAGCASAKCDTTASRCTYVANDADEDGHRAYSCASQEPTVAVETGDDCDDGDAQLFPGHPRSCSALPDGTVITFPGGAPKGICKAGVQACEPDGRLGACTGAVAPAPESCATEDVDEDCDGSPVNGCPCTPIASTRACNTHPGKDGVGTCRAGSQTCEPGGWSSCTGGVDPTIDDCRVDGADADCDGIKGNGSSCTRTVYMYGRGAFNCAAGSSLWPDDLYISDEDDPEPLPNQLTLITSMKLFASGGGTKVAVYRCFNGASGFHYVGYAGCGADSGLRLVGYASNVSGGPGWVQIGGFFGRDFGPTGIMPVTSPACGTCCNTSSSYYTLE